MFDGIKDHFHKLAIWVSGVFLNELLIWNLIIGEQNLITLWNIKISESLRADDVVRQTSKDSLSTGLITASSAGLIFLMEFKPAMFVFDF